MPHIHEKIDFCVETFIVHSNKVLLRKHDKLKTWLGVGGHIELNEDPTEAAIREVREEVGLDIELFDDQEKNQFQEASEKILVRPQYVNRHNITDTHEHVAFVFFATSNTDKFLLSESEVTDEIKWFSKEDLDNLRYNLKPKVKFYAKKALGKLAKN